MKIQKYLTYKFSKFGRTNRRGSWAEDKFFKLLLFRNLYRQQGNNSNKNLMGWFDFLWCCWYRLKTQTETNAAPVDCGIKHEYLSHYDERFSVSTCNWVEQRLIGFLYSPGGWSLYEIYLNQKRKLERKRNSEEKNYTSFSAPFFFSRD